jgi:hypothetical protein
MSGRKNDFDIDFEELSEEEESDSGFDNMSILPDPPKLGGKGYDTEIYGSKARHHGGQPSTPPLFAQANSFPDVTQLRVWKIENGTPTSLGTISSESGEDQFVKHFFNAMPKVGEGSCIYQLRPLGINGDEIGSQFTLNINENHTVLQKMRKLNSTPQQGMNPQFIYGGGGFGSLPEGFLSVMENTLQANQRALEEERERTAELMANIAQERVDLASNTASSVQMVTERMMEADARRQEAHQHQEAERHSQMQEQMQSFFQNNIEMMRNDQENQQRVHSQQKDREQNFFQTILQDAQTRMERESERAKEERHREREAHSRQLELERERRNREREEDARKWERELQRIELQRTREKDEFERKERERLRQLESQRDRDKADSKERERERQRNFEFKMEQARIQAQQDKEYQERMMQAHALSLQQDQKQSFKEVLSSTFETLSGLGLEPQDVLTKIFGGKESDSDDGGTLASIAKIASTAGEVLKSQQMQGAQIAEAQHMAAQQIQEQQRAQRALLMSRQQQMSDQREIPPDYSNYQPPQQQPAQQPAPEEVKPPTPKSSLPLSRQKDARLAMRKLVVNLSRNKVEKWEDLITVAIASEPAMYEYINEITVYYALEEAGADNELATKIVSELQKSNLVPDDLNYGAI